METESGLASALFTPSAAGQADDAAATSTASTSRRFIPIGAACGFTRVLAAVSENWGMPGPLAKASASSLDMGWAKKNPWAASALNERTISTWDAVSTRSTMADMPSEWAMWITVSTTNRLMPSECSSPEMKEPSILSVLIEYRFNSSNDDQFVPTSSTDNWTPICDKVRSWAEASESTMASSVTSRLSCPLWKPVCANASATACEISPLRSWSTVQFTPSWMLGDHRLASSHASMTIHRVRGPMSPLASARGISWSGEIRPSVGCCQRTRASIPSRRPLERSTTGRYSR